jgi:hypothetical protein
MGQSMSVCLSHTSSRRYISGYHCSRVIALLTSSSIMWHKERLQNVCVLQRIGRHLSSLVATCVRMCMYVFTISPVEDCACYAATRCVACSSGGRPPARQRSVSLSTAMCRLLQPVPLTWTAHYLERTVCLVQRVSWAVLTTYARPNNKAVLPISRFHGFSSVYYEQQFGWQPWQNDGPWFSGAVH